MLPSAKGLSFTLCWVSLPTFFYLRSKHLCQLCALIPTYLLICVDNYPWDIHVEVESNRWNLYLPLCCFNAFTLNLLLYELTLMQVLLMLVLKVLLMKSLCYMIQLFNHHLYHCFDSLHSSHVLYNSMIKIMLVACHFRNYSCYCLPTRGRVGTKLGDAWYVSNVSIISDVPC